MNSKPKLPKAPDGFHWDFINGKPVLVKDISIEEAIEAVSDEEIEA